MRADISGEFTAIRSEIREINVQLANISHRIQIFEDESQVSKYRLDRLETWAPKVGDKTSIPFEF
jgi:chromosome segregation ATPase